MHRFSVYILITISTLLGVISCKNPSRSKNNVPAEFEETWESLATIDREPEWFKDAKLGIYFHWGPYSVPAFDNEWYPRWMYVPGRESWGGQVYGFHEKNFGPVSEFNYHDFIPMFTAEHFDAAEWAELFHKSGARFAGLVAQHHDGFAMWGSKINPWNAKEMGPEKDILGELFAELKNRDMQTIATFHHERLLQRYATDTARWAKNTPDPGWDSHYPYHPDYITSTTDPKLRLLYGNMPEDEFYDYWLGQINEVVDNYAPDMIWFDSWLDIIPEDYLQKMVAHHFNTAVSRGQQPIVNYKQEDLPANVGILDMEQGGKTELSDDYWLTDITISYGSWCYTNVQSYKNPALVIRNMIDAWSKRGIVLLNISPMANGIIPNAQREVLSAIGQWIHKHEEAVYETRAYTTFGYGRAEFEPGHFGGQSATMDYNHKDIRFAVSKDNKYLFVYSLGLPEPNTNFEIHHVDATNIKRVSVVGSGVKLKWSKTGDVLTIRTPTLSEMDELATVFKIELELMK